ncbi:MAG: hypothetical protein NTX17_02965 [Candidatus Eisenbacteria bacterium]|nr:hypothetical protein [Candidatus Eisenbacteria bacterium]
MGDQAPDTTKSTAREMDVAHPFFTHMGMPEGVGNYTLRLDGTATTGEGKTEGDFGFHLETGLSETIGLHIRNDRVSSNPHTEITFQFAALSSHDRMSGFSPFMEFEIPTHEGEKTIYTLVGFSTAWATSGFALNQSLEYSPKEEDVEGSASAVVKLSERFFPVVEFIGEAVKGSPPLYTMLGGLKGRISRRVLIGAAYKVPLSSEKEFDSQVLVETDLEW